MDLARLQRTLFRMQCDAAFGERVLAGDRAAIESTALGDAELALLQELSPAGLRADPKDVRKNQVLGNLATEYVLTLADAASAGEDDFLEAFLASDEFHACMAAGERLPLAFGAYASRRAIDVRTASFAGLVELERAMVRVRRADASAPKLSPGDVLLAPGAELVRLVAGLLTHADWLRTNLEAGVPPPVFRPLQGSDLVLVAPRPGANPFALGEVHIERLEPPTDELLDRAREPFARADRATFAARFGASPEDLEGFVDGLVADGLLVRG